MNTEDLQVIRHNETEFPDYVVREFKLVDTSVSVTGGGIGTVQSTVGV